MPGLKTILRNVRNELKEKEKARESSQAEMRKATSLSKRAILLVHQRRFREAKKLAAYAAETISKLKVASGSHPSLIYCGMYSAALQEYSEAMILLRLVEKSEFVTPEEISVPSVEYVLGLSDVIGEYRRLALDAIREGEIRKSEECLRKMDEIYVELMAMDEAYMLVPGLRRKCDVARKIIEITRGDVTQEIRRSKLETYLKRLEKQAGKIR